MTPESLIPGRTYMVPVGGVTYEAAYLAARNADTRFNHPAYVVHRFILKDASAWVELLPETVEKSVTEVQP